jgi:predicted AAA+ superfamily ATPase
VKKRRGRWRAMDLVTGAAKDLVTGAVGSLISKLGKLLNEEYKLQKGVSKKIGSLIKELECADAALRKVAGVPPDQLEEQDRIWACEVREASYDMEDVLDTILLSAQRDQPAEQTDHQSLFEYLQMKMTNVYSMVVSAPLKRRKIAVTVDDINKRLQEVTERHRRYRPEDIVSKPATKSTVDPRLAAMYKQVTQLVGIEKPSAQLISLLSLAQEDKASNKKMKIVSVVGTGGLGKTTLAKAVYDKVNVDFQCQAFVSVGRDPDLKKVFRDILIGLDKMKYMDPKMIILDEGQLIDELREYLGSKRYGSATQFYFTHISIMMSIVFSCASLTVT